jgi:ATP-dependent Lhr-like helicase
MDEIIESKGVEEIIDFLCREFNLSYSSAKAIYNYFYEQKSFSLIPTDKRLVVECFRDEKGYCYVFHTLIGRRANDAISRVFAYRIGKIKGCNVRITITDNGFMLRLPEKLSVEEIKALFDVNNFREDLIKSLDKTELLRRRFRHVAVRSFMILRNYLGKEKCVYRQQISADNLLKLLKKYFPDFPVLRETYREIVEDFMDVNNALDYLKKIVNGSIGVEVVELPTPSPFSLNIYLIGEEDVVLMADRRRILKMLHDMIVERLRQRS